MFPIHSIQVNPRTYKSEVITYCLFNDRKNKENLFKKQNIITKITLITDKKKNINNHIVYYNEILSDIIYTV